MDARFIDIDIDDDEPTGVRHDEHEPLTVRINEIERRARTGTNVSTDDALWLITTLKAVMADRVSLIRGIAKSADLLGDALDTVDVPDRLVDDLTTYPKGGWTTGDDAEVGLDAFEDLFDEPTDDPLDEIEARR